MQKALPIWSDLGRVFVDLGTTDILLMVFAVVKAPYLAVKSFIR